MKKKILKVGIVALLIITMTMVNFVFVGNSLISYAIDNISTNNSNIEFSAYFKDNEGKEITNVEKQIEDSNMNLYFYVKVKKQGYFDGKIILEEGNFTLTEIENEWINKIEDNTITLNQINAEQEIEIEVPVKFIKSEEFNVDLLNMKSKIRLEGIYKDSTQKDKEIKATKMVTLKLVPSNTTSNNIENTAKVITNKTLIVEGESKRVIQVLLDLGLKDNSYPIKEINVSTKVPSMDEEQPEVSVFSNLNAMTKYTYNYENEQVSINFKNEPDEQNYVLWDNEGKQTAILTYLYKTTNIEDITIGGKIDITLYDNSKIETDIPEILINKDEEKEEVLTANIKQTETMMHKGKLYEGIDRELITTDSINVNTTDILNYIEISEEDIFTSEPDYENKAKLQGIKANIVYTKTTINKEQLFKILGEDGNIIIRNDNGNNIAVITKETQADEDGNIVVDYGTEGQKGIVIKTTAPVQAGKIDITHYKTIKQNENSIIENSINLDTALFITTNLNINEEKNNCLQDIKTIELKETATDAILEVSRKELSTVIENEIELKAILKSQKEENDLYKNPTLNIEFPEDVEEIYINDVSIVYEDELEIKEWSLDGRILTIQLQGEQTHYSDNAIEGANIIINGKIKINRKAVSKDSAIIMTYTNEKARTYVNEGKIESNIRIVAPTDITTVTSIEQLNVEEINQDETKEITLQRGKQSKEITTNIEVINNKEIAAKDVKILGNFPTGNEEGKIGISLTSPIQTENGKVYYSENENATEDLSDEQNGWNEEITSPSTTKKYLIAVDEVNSQESISASYNAEIPANLEYNENATQDYKVIYTDSLTNSSNTIKSTQLKMTTGIGPKLQVKVSAKVGNNDINNNDIVRAGEVINYHVEVSNIGTENIDNITLLAPIPEGTTYVQEKQNYEYTGTSYYEEIEKENCKEIIPTINTGETITRDYKVRVNSDITDGSNIKNKTLAKFDDVITESNELAATAKAGTIRTSIKRITDHRNKLIQGNSVIYYAIVENTSSQTIDNVIVKTNMTGLKVSNLSVITGLTSEDVSDDDLIDIGDELTDDIELQNEIEEDDDEVIVEEIKYEPELNIGSIDIGKNKIIKYTCIVEPADKIELSTITIHANNEYRSNIWNDTIEKENASINLSSNTSSKYIKDTDILEYTINVKNEGSQDLLGLMVKDEIPNDLTIKEIKVDGKTTELPEEDNKIYQKIDLEQGEEKSINIEAIVDDVKDRKEAKEISNIATLTYRGEEIAKVTEVNHIIQADEQKNNDNTANGGNGSSNSSGEGNNQVSNNNIASGTKVISGMAWYDENANGQRDNDEKTISGVTVNLLNTETNKLVKDKNGNNIIAKTNENGTYILNNIGNGKYIVIFDYDKTQYSVTKYMSESVSETNNSNAMINELSIEGEAKNVASTDIIQIQNDNVSDINIGLVKLQNFDFKLEKFVNKIIVQNSAGTALTEYNNSTMAKTEIHSKQINGSIVLIEYKIRVTNVGEVDGYVKKIADYIPSDLKFSSELNKDWYQSEAGLYNTSLANEKIPAGESKELTLTLTKSMTEDNTGRINNTAEIIETYNDLGLVDSNSTPGNKTKGENDMGSADVIISIKTGGVILYTAVIAIMILILSGITLPVKKRIRKNNKSTHKLDKI